MKILQGSNGKIQFWVAGKISFSCLPAQNYRVMSDTEIHLISAGVKVLSIFSNEITDIQVLGGAVVPTTFNNSQELAESLDSNFFFEVAASGNIFSFAGLTGGYTQSQNASFARVTSTAHNPAKQYAIPLILGGGYTEFSMLKKASGFGGNINFAIYDSGTDGYPNNKIWQSAEFAVTIAAELLQSTLSPPVTFASAVYWFSWHGDQAFTWEGAAEFGLLGFSLSGTTLSNIRRVNSNVVYASTLPNTWTAPILDSLSGTPPLLLQIKDI